MLALWALDVVPRHALRGSALFFPRVFCTIRQAELEGLRVNHLCCQDDVGVRIARTRGRIEDLVRWTAGIVAVGFRRHTGFRRVVKGEAVETCGL